MRLLLLIGAVSAALGIDEVPKADDGFFFRDSTGSLYSASDRYRNNKDNLGPEVWVKGWHKLDKTARERTSQTLYRIDCARGTITMLSYVGYDAQGQIIGRQEPTYPAQNRIIPESLGDELAKQVCPPASAK